MSMNYIRKMGDTILEQCFLNLIYFFFFYQSPLESLIKLILWDLTPRISDSTCLWWKPKIFIFSKYPGDAAAAVLGHTLLQRWSLHGLLFFFFKLDKVFKTSGNLIVPNKLFHKMRNYKNYKIWRTVF